MKKCSLNGSGSDENNVAEMEAGISQTVVHGPLGIREALTGGPQEIGFFL